MSHKQKTLHLFSNYKIHYTTKKKHSNSYNQAYKYKNIRKLKYKIYCKITRKW